MKDQQTPKRPPDGAFTSFTHWVNYATRLIGGMNSACYDAKGRRCLIGKDFMLARDENAFPVSYWHGEGGQTKAEQRKSIQNMKAMDRINHPWRYA